MDSFERWFQALEKRHLSALTFQEVRRALQALSSLYVERRSQLDSKNNLAGSGKRAAFAYFYGPLHFLTVREIVRALNASGASRILDLGCGTGVAAAAWALEMKERPKILGIDRNPWAVEEARWTYSTFELSATVKVSDVGSLRIPSNSAVIAAFTMNELADGERDRLRAEFVKASERGSPVLVVEPIARRLTSWWNEWAGVWRSAGGREDEWRFRIQLPDQLALMDKAAGLDHRELTARSLWLPPARR